jgi:hypothetical protein
MLGGTVGARHSLQGDHQGVAMYHRLTSLKGTGELPGA